MCPGFEGEWFSDVGIEGFCIIKQTNKIMCIVTQ